MDIQDYLHPAPGGITGYAQRPDVGGIRAMAKSRTKKEWDAVNRAKEDRYGTDEVFADPAHHSYPLTKDGKPSAERTKAAWDYIHQHRDADEYSHGRAEQIIDRIHAFARRHFGIDLQP